MLLHDLMGNRCVPLADDGMMDAMYAHYDCGMIDHRGSVPAESVVGHLVISAVGKCHQRQPTDTTKIDCWKQTVVTREKLIKSSIFILGDVL